VHEQCGTRSEAELRALLATLAVASLLRAAVSDLRGIFVRPPAGALAWKRADPFLPARWLYDESDVVEAAELDPDIVVRVTQSPGSRSDFSGCSVRPDPRPTRLFASRSGATVPLPRRIQLAVTVDRRGRRGDERRSTESGGIGRSRRPAHRS